MKLLITLVVAMSLVGCATPADRRKQPPNIETSSKKSAKEVASCITEKWENVTSFGSGKPINTNIKLNGYSIMITETAAAGNTNTWALVDVLENQSESTTKYYRDRGPGFGDYDKAVTDCQ